MFNFNPMGESDQDTYVPGYAPAGYIEPDLRGWSAWDTASGLEPTMRDLNQIHMNDVRNVFSDGWQLDDIGSLRDIFKNWRTDASDMATNTGVGKAVRGATDATSELWGELSGPEKFSTVWGGLQTLGNMYGTYKGFQMAKDQQRFQKDMWNKTWEANKKQFNEAVGARADSRYNTAADQEERKAHKDKYSI